MTHHMQRYFLRVTLICIVLLALGFLGAQLLNARTEAAKKRSLLKDAQRLALLVDPVELRVLAANTSDLEKQEYRHLKTVFTAFRNTDPNVRFAYLLGFNETLRKQFFYVDSEDPSSNDYSPPGQIYTDTKTKDIAGYLSGEPYIEDAYTDSWGQWVSGYAPVFDENGKMIAQAGVDVSTARWHRQNLINNLLVGGNRIFELYYYITYRFIFV